MIGVDVVVGVPLHRHRPASGIELDEPNPTLDQAAGQQASCAEFGGFRIVESVQRLGLGRLFRQVDGFGSFALHAEGEFVGGDSRGEFGVVVVETFLVHPFEKVERLASPGGGNTVGRPEVEDR